MSGHERARAMLQKRRKPLLDTDMKSLHRPIPALMSAISLTGLVAIECGIVAGVLLLLHIEPI